MLAHAAVQPFCQAFARGIRAIIQRDIGFGHFAQIIVRHADHQRFLDRRVFDQHGFHLAGKHLEPANRDHILAAVHNRDEAVFILRGDIAGAEP